MRTRQEIEDDADTIADKPMIEQADLAQLGKLMIELLLDIRDMADPTRE